MIRRQHDLEELIQDALAKGREVQAAGLPVADCTHGEVRLGLRFVGGQVASLPVAGAAPFVTIDGRPLAEFFPQG